METVPLDASYADGYVLNLDVLQQRNVAKGVSADAMDSRRPDFIPTDCMSYLSFFTETSEGAVRLKPGRERLPLTAPICPCTSGRRGAKHRRGADLSAWQRACPCVRLIFSVEMACRARIRPGHNPSAGKSKSGSQFFSPELKTAQARAGRLLRMPDIQSNCGCCFRKASASKAVPHADPQRAAKDMCRAISESTTFASIVPLGSKGTCRPAGSVSKSHDCKGTVHRGTPFCAMTS